MDRQRVVVITGGTAGVGAKLVESYSEQGWRVVTCGRNSARIAELHERLPGVDAREVDLANRESLETFAVSLGMLDHVDLLINNAAVQHNVLLAEHRVGAIFDEFTTNLIAPSVIISALLPALQRSRGIVVNVSSGLAFVPKSDAAVYCASKAGLSGLSGALRQQLHGGQVRVLDVMLPLVATQMTAAREDPSKITADRAARAIIAATGKRRSVVPIGRVRLLTWINKLTPWLARRIMR